MLLNNKDRAGLRRFKNCHSNNNQITKFKKTEKIKGTVYSA